MLIQKTRVAIVAATLALVTAVGGVAATTLPASGAAEVHVRKFIAKQIGRDHPLGKASFVSSDVERHKGKVIGTDSISGHFYVKKGIVKIFVAVAWKGGALIIRGHAGKNTPFVGRIVRGTGKYAGATGTVTTRDLKHRRTAVTVRYTLK